MAKEYHLTVFTKNSLLSCTDVGAFAIPKARAAVFPASVCTKLLTVNVPFPPVISLWWRKQRIDLPGIHGKGHQPFVLKVDFANKVVSGSFGDPIGAHGQRPIFHATYAPQRRSQQHEPRFW